MLTACQYFIGQKWAGIVVPPACLDGVIIACRGVTHNKNRHTLWSTIGDRCVIMGAKGSGSVAGYYYNQLNKAEKAVYDALKAGLNDLQPVQPDSKDRI